MDFFEWLKTQEGWSHLELHQVELEFNRLDEATQRQIRVVYSQQMRATPEEEAGLPTQTTLPTGETIDVDWTEPQDVQIAENEWITLSFPILPVNAMNRENIISLMQLAYGYIWDNIDKEMVVRSSAYASLATERMTISGLTVEDFLASPGLEADIIGAATKWTLGEFAPKAALPEVPEVAPPPRELAIPVEEGEVYRREWTKLDPWQKRAILEKYPERLGGMETIEAAEAGTFPYMPRTPSAMELPTEEIARRQPVSREIWAKNLQLQQQSLQEAETFLKERQRKYGEKREALRLQQERAFRQLSERARLAGQRRERVVGI